MADAVLEVTNLSVLFDTARGPVTVLRNVSFRLPTGHALGLVGESGCGKTVTALAVTRLLQCAPARISSGSVKLRGEELLTASDERMRQVRGGEIGIVFQDPMTSLNPVMRVGWQIAEAVLAHRKLRRREAWSYAVDLLRRVQIPHPDRRAHSYPHSLSGGMRQRVAIAMAIAAQPTVLIADEPTTALDVTIQAEVLELLKALRQEYGLSVLFISHDLSVVSEFCDLIAVMYAGEIVEHAPAEALFRHPFHPYTSALLAALPDASAHSSRRRLDAIPGLPPDPASLPTGCAFHPRCPRAMPICQKEPPPQIDHQCGRWVRCWLFGP
ncbi:MAG: ABC transporter ATP-binding protein [Armatimonadota bacterium]